VLQIFHYEEICVCKACPDHLFVAIGHHIQPAPIPVAHGNKIGQQRSCGVEHRKVTLVLFHHRDQHIRRELKVRGVKFSQQRSRCFHQLIHFIQQHLVNDRRAAHFSAQTINLRADRIPAFLRIQQNPLAAEITPVFIQ